MGMTAECPSTGMGPQEAQRAMVECANNATDMAAVALFGTVLALIACLWILMLYHLAFHHP